MTAFAFKRAGEKGMAEVHPWGTDPHLIPGILTPALQAG